MNARNPIPDSHGSGYPVAMVNRSGRVLRTFRSRGRVFAEMGIWDSALRRALDNGTPIGGVWWRYADMPAAVQPLREPMRRGPKPGKKQVRRAPYPLMTKPKEDPYAPGGRLHDLAAMRNKTKG